MKQRVLTILALTLFLLSWMAQSSRGAANGWQVVAPGVEYQKFQLPDPNNVFVTRLDRAYANLIIESALGEGRVGGREVMSGMAKRYEGSINYWNETWGNRNDVIVAINGSYFDYNTNTIFGGQVHSGWYAKRFQDCQSGSGGSGFAFKFDRSVFIGASVFHPRDKQVVTYLSDGSEYQEFQGTNVPRGDDELILYTPQYGSNTRTDGSGSEVLVELQEPALIRKGMVVGKVVDVRKNAGSNPIPFDHVVLSAEGSAENRLLNYADEGDEIGISQKIKGYQYAYPCNKIDDSVDWNDTYASVDGAFYFLQAGQIHDFDDLGATARHPRTAVAYNDQYIFFIVVDGRDKEHSRGMSIRELAEFTRNVLGASHGVAQDGGGSSTMVVNGEVVNNTYCNNVDCDNNQLEPGKLDLRITRQPPLISGDGLPLTEQYYRYGTDATGAEILQRLVANGLMMVRVEPRQLSGKFASQEEVLNREENPLLLGPGRNYPPVTTAPDNTFVTLLDHPLEGVRAGGSFWWKVRLPANGSTAIGWLPEENLLSIYFDEFVFLPLIQH